jgi:hypothetical protein
MAYIKRKTIGGQQYNYLYKSQRVTEKGKVRVKQVMLAYLGKAYTDETPTVAEAVYNAWMNADVKRRTKLQKYLDPQDLVAEAQERANEAAEREYRRKLKQKLTREIVKKLLPKLPEQYLADLDL